MSNVLASHLAKHFTVSFDMLKRHIDNCPDYVWDKRYGGFVFWQQLLHAFEGVLYWMRSDEYNASAIDPSYHADLERMPELPLTKDELKKIVSGIEKQANDFLSHIDDGWLNTQSHVKKEMLNIDVVINQIRHIQYHVGHCNCILRELGCTGVAWIGYLENTD